MSQSGHSVDPRYREQDGPVPECVLCRCYHVLPFCRVFLSMPVMKRRKAMKRHNRCFNCLAPSHTPERCASTQTCERCGKLHHTLLHLTLATILPSRRRRRRRTLPGQVLMPPPGAGPRGVPKLVHANRVRRERDVGGNFERDVRAAPVWLGKLVRRPFEPERAAVIAAMRQNLSLD